MENPMTAVRLPQMNINRIKTQTPKRVNSIIYNFLVLEKENNMKCTLSK